MKKRLAIFGLLLSAILTISWLSDDNSFMNRFVNLPESVKIYFYIEKYSDKYGIPKNIAYGIPHYESGYNGPDDTAYNPKNKISTHKAYGAMQLKCATANYVSDTTVTKKDLLNNTELNVELSYKLLNRLHEKYGSWKLALGAYNTGKPVVNKYATKILKFNHAKYVKKDNALLAYAIKESN